MESKVFTFNNVSFSYRLFLADEHTKLLPLIVAFSSESNDHVVEKLISEEMQKKHLSHVIFPEFRDWTDPVYAQALQRLIFQVRGSYEMDVCRTYLIGSGLGAVAAWHMLGSYPRVFAGTLAIDGCGDPYHVRNAVYAPVWAFHAKQDKQFNVKGSTDVFGKKFLAGSKRLFDALRTAGSTQSNYTELDCTLEDAFLTVLSNDDIMNWLFTQDRKNVVWVYMMKPGIYRFDDWFMSSCYLILGKEKALLIDTTMAHQRLLPIIQKITALPVYLAITHPHMDHMLQAYDYDTIYIHEDAASTIENQLETMYKMLSEGGAMKINTHMIPPFMKDAMKLHTVKPIQEGWKIDLGGDCWIEARFVGGHTPYDLVFIDYLHHAVFTGDAVGSGYVVGVNYPASKFNEAYEKYRDNLQRLIDYIEPKGEFTYYGGHYIQENSCEDAWQEDYLNGQSQFFVPLTFGLIQDMKVLCDKLLQGDYSEQISKEDGSFFVSWGDASLSARRIEKK